MFDADHWQTDVPGAIPPGEEPSDRCPHRRPFPADFTGCPAHQAVTFVPTDSLHRPLGTALTCRHLTAGQAGAGTSTRYYARCALGASSERLRWLAMVTPARLEVMRVLQAEFDAATAAHRDALFTTRAACRDEPRSIDLRHELEARVREFLAAATAFVEKNADRFADVGLPPGPLLRLVDDLAWAWARSRGSWDDGRRWVDGRSRAAGRGRGDDLEALPLASQAFLRPVAEAPWRQPVAAARDDSSPVAAAEAGEVLLDTGEVRVVRHSGPSRVSLSGEVDAANAELVAGALAQGLAGQGDRHLDLSGLLFCAVGGLRAMVRAARGVEPGGRVLVHGMPAHLQRAMRLVGWAEQPSLVLAGNGVHP
jgi:STAS domain